MEKKRLKEPVPVNLGGGHCMDRLELQISNIEEKRSEEETGKKERNEAEKRKERTFCIYIREKEYANSSLSLSLSLSVYLEPKWK